MSNVEAELHRFSGFGNFLFFYAGWWTEGNQIINYQCLILPLWKNSIYTFLHFVNILQLYTALMYTF